MSIRRTERALKMYNRYLDELQEKMSAIKDRCLDSDVSREVRKVAAQRRLYVENRGWMSDPRFTACEKRYTVLCGRIYQQATLGQRMYLRGLGYAEDVSRLSHAEAIELIDRLVNSELVTQIESAILGRIRRRGVASEADFDSYPSAAVKLVLKRLEAIKKIKREPSGIYKNA